jgi:hypothetical protein
MAGAVEEDAGMKYCELAADPAKTFANTPPKPRDQVWHRREVLKLVQVAWRNEFYGLAALMAAAWDSQLSPIDNRNLTLAQIRSDAEAPFSQSTAPRPARQPQKRSRDAPRPSWSRISGSSGPSYSIQRRYRIAEER